MGRTGNILHCLAMEGVAETGTVVGDTGVPEAEVTDTLEELEEQGFVESEGFWYLTDEGEAHLDELLRQRFSSEELDELENRYPEFESLDIEFKDLANAWQQSDDEGNNEKLIEQLAEHHRDVESYVAAFSDPIQTEYETYVGDLESALETLQEGNEEYYTGTEVDSYHTVWFHWHDDLLITLGKERDE